MKIIIRQEHIKNAIKKDSHHCMIADAIKDKLGVQYISVDTQSIKFSEPKTGERLTYLTPPNAQEMILRWDRGIQVQPFSFDLTDPVKVEPRRTKWKGKNEVKLKAQRKYDKKRRDPMAPRLVRKNKVKISRFREFGIRKWTKESK